MQLLNKRILYLAVLISIAAAIQITERVFTAGFLWFKPGLANLITLITLVSIGKKSAIVVVIGRTLAASLFIGTFLGPSFVLSFSAGVIAVLSMVLIYKPFGKLSLIGVSVAGAIVHSVVQLLIAGLLLIDHRGIFFLLPVMLIIAVITGIINGKLAKLIIPKIHQYAFKKIYLASSSIQRINILSTFCVPLEVIGHKAKEDIPCKEDKPEEFALKQARKKIDSIELSNKESGIVLASDTIVELDGEIFGKPRDENSAYKMLKRLSGRLQKVHTAVVLINLNDKKRYEFVDTTKLRFRELDKEEIDSLKNQSLDKAGGYAIQGMDDKYIKELDGSYSNVVGLPIEKLGRIINRIW